jgi:uncharacterized BrkB/YihY/UPF0761 family membrane protein
MAALLLIFAISLCLGVFLHMESSKCWANPKKSFHLLILGALYGLVAPVALVIAIPFLLLYFYMEERKMFNVANNM